MPEQTRLNSTAALVEGRICALEVPGGGAAVDCAAAGVALLAVALARPQRHRAAAVVIHLSCAAVQLYMEHKDLGIT